jgi:hypothetical protein
VLGLRLDQVPSVLGGPSYLNTPSDGVQVLFEHHPTEAQIAWVLVIDNWLPALSESGLPAKRKNLLCTKEVSTAVAIGAVVLAAIMVSAVFAFAPGIGRFLQAPSVASFKLPP